MANEIEKILLQAVMDAKEHRPVSDASPQVKDAYCQGVHDALQMMAAMAVKTEEASRDLAPATALMGKYYSKMLREMVDIISVTLIPDGYEP